MDKSEQHGSIANESEGRNAEDVTIVSTSLNQEQIQRDLLAHEVKVKEAERQLQELHEEGRKLKQRLNDTSPFLSLPVDVISEIFHLSYEPLYWYDFKCLPTQFVIGRTCQAWREIAWSQSRLWQEVSIVLADSRFDQQLHLLKEWLDRSAGRLISLGFMIHPKAMQKKWTPPPAFYHAILQTCHRWKIAQIPDGMCDGLISTLTSRGTTFEFPELKELYMGKPTQHFAEWPFNFPSQLRELSFSVAETLESPKILLKWSQLTSLTVSCSAVFFLDVIQQCRSLIYLKFDCPDNTDDDDIDSQLVETPHINLPFLEKISYSGESRWLSLLVRTITAPSLHGMFWNFALYEAIPELWVTNAIQMVKRSNCKLKFFSLMIDVPSSPFDEENFIDLVNALPYLEMIFIDVHFALSNRLIDLLTLETESPSVEEVKSAVPNLTSFSYYRKSAT